MAFLQGRDPTLAHRIGMGGFLPEGERCRALDAYAAGDDDPLAWAFGSLGTTDRARHLATLYLDDIADVVKGGVDPRFEFVRYAEKLAASQRRRPARRGRARASRSAAATSTPSCASWPSRGGSISSTPSR